MPSRVPAAELLRDLIAHVPVHEAARATLLGFLGGADRYYHGVSHVALLWARHLQFSVGTALATETPTRLIACAIAYHDAIYDPIRRDNEARSAALWSDHAALGLMPANEVDWVAETIIATADHFGQTKGGLSWAPARTWLLDLDLTPLGETADDFTRDTALLRAEYAHLAEPEWVAGRAAFLASLARHPMLFRTPILHDTFEAAARRNIAAALESLRRSPV